MHSVKFLNPHDARWMHGRHTRQCQRHAVCARLMRYVPSQQHPHLRTKQNRDVSYQVWLWRFPLVIAMHDSADWDSSEPWVSENMSEVTLSGPSWVENI